MKSLRTKTIKRKTTKRHTSTRSLPRIARAPKSITPGDVQPKKANSELNTEQPAAPPIEPPTPAPRLTPPFEITDAERSELLARHRFQQDDVVTDTEKCGAVLDDIAYEIEGLAEAVTHAINDLDHDEQKSSRQMADTLMAFSRSLADVSSRMMRYAGRLEAYRDVQARVDKADDMVKAWVEGGLGKPAPRIAVGLAGQHARESEVSS